MKKGVPVEVKTIHYDIMSPIKNLKLALEIVDMGMEVVEQVITMADGPEENTVPNEDRQCREVDEQLYYRGPEECGMTIQHRQRWKVDEQLCLRVPEEQCHTIGV